MKVLALLILGFLLLAVAALWARYELQRLKRNWAAVVHEELTWFAFLAHEPFLFQAIGLVALTSGGLVCIFKAVSALISAP